MTRTEAVNKVLNIARAEIGYHEKVSNSQLDDKTANSGSANYTKYARDLDAIPNFYNGKKNGYAWCDIFHDWIHVQAWGGQMAMKVLCQPAASAGAGCVYSANYYKAAGQWATSPQPGDQIFFYADGMIGHTGIVESVSGSTVTTIEGNTSDMVARRTYNLSSSYIAGYGRPKYELVCDGDAGQAQPVATAPNKYYLQYGDANEYVRELQEALIKLGYSCGTYGADGDFGNDTLSAVMKYQVDRGLAVDGIVGEATWRKIEADLKAQKPQPTDTTTPATPVVTETVSDEQAIWNRLYSYIGNAFGVAGVEGNFYAESGLRANNVENSYENSLGMGDAQYTAAVDNGSYGNFVHDSAGYGLYQATYWSIKQHLLEFAKAKGKSIGDRDMQVDAFVDLIQKSYPAVWQTLKAATSVRQASDAVLLKFERPRDQSEAAQAKRASFGQKYYDKYAGGKTTTGTSVVQTQKPELHYGSTGEYVVALQKRLIELGYSCGSCGADGDFGNDTTVAVRAFQQENGLVVDGIVGAMTWATLEKAKKRPAPTTVTETYAPSVGDTVMFNGTTHYITAIAGNGSACRGGKAKITQIVTNGNPKHPYHLVATPGGGATVHGWVDSGTFEKV